MKFSDFFRNFNPKIQYFNIFQFGPYVQVEGGDAVAIPDDPAEGEAAAGFESCEMRCPDACTWMTMDKHPVAVGKLSVHRV